MEDLLRPAAARRSGGERRLHLHDCGRSPSSAVWLAVEHDGLGVPRLAEGTGLSFSTGIKGSERRMDI
jgi:hypothetical protein